MCSYLFSFLFKWIVISILHLCNGRHHCLFPTKWAISRSILTLQLPNFIHNLGGPWDTVLAHISWFHTPSSATPTSNLINTLGERNDIGKQYLWEILLCVRNINVPGYHIPSEVPHPLLTCFKHKVTHTPHRLYKIFAAMNSVCPTHL